LRPLVAAAQRELDETATGDLVDWLLTLMICTRRCRDGESPRRTSGANW